jgi:hypothetical protein
MESFDWPKKPRVWFWRCVTCQKMSDTAPTPEAADALTIEANHD